MLLVLVSQIFIIILIVFSLILILIIISFIECNTYKLTNYTINNNKNSGNLSIIYISDFHNKNFHGGLIKIIDKILSQKPNIIIFGGDIINFSKIMLKKREIGINNAINFISELTSKINNNSTLNKSIKIFYALGNHELRLKTCKDLVLENEYLEFIRFLLNCNINVLDDGIYNINNSFSLSTLNLYKGYYNKIFSKNNNFKEINVNVLDNYFSKKDDEKFNVALFHKPDYAIDFIKYGFDLVLSGHYHGGLIKLPFIGALFSPDFKFLPRYSYGLYKILNKYIIVSSGLGEHFINIRINNRPEICLINIIGNGRD